MMNKRRYRGVLWGWMALGAVVILLWGRVVYDSAEQGKVAMREMAEKSLQEVAELELNRAFKKQNQSHYCGDAPKTIAQYIEAQSEEVQPYLRSVRNAIHDAIPEAQERISWSMPTFWKGHNIIHFAANKKHIGLYAGEEAVIEFEEILKPYKTSKGTIQIPYKEPLPLDLIARIASWCYETGNHT